MPREVLQYEVTEAHEKITCDGCGVVVETKSHKEFSQMIYGSGWTIVGSDLPDKYFCKKCSESKGLR